MLFDAWNCDEFVAAVIHFLSDFVFNKINLPPKQIFFTTRKGQVFYYHTLTNDQMYEISHP